MNNLFNTYFVSPPERNADLCVALPSRQSPRLIVPLHSRKAFRTGLMMHNTAAHGNRIAKFIIGMTYPLIKFYRSARVSAGSKVVELTNLVAEKLRLDLPPVFSAYVGTPSRNQKLTLQIQAVHGEIIGYLKIAWEDSSKAFLLNEYSKLLYISQLGLKSVHFPSPLFFESKDDCTLLCESNVFLYRSTAPFGLTDQIVDSMIELAIQTRTDEKLQDFLDTISREAFAAIPPEYLTTSLRGFIEMSIQRIGQLDVPLVFVHGDFVPYNLKLDQQSISLVDWEFAQSSGFPLYDLFHYLFQGAIQIRALEPERIIEKRIISHRKYRTYFTHYLNRLSIAEGAFIPLLTLYFAQALVTDIAVRQQENLRNNHFYRGLVYLKDSHHTY